MTNIYYSLLISFGTIKCWPHNLKPLEHFKTWWRLYTIFRKKSKDAWATFSEAFLWWREGDMNHRRCNVPEEAFPDTSIECTKPKPRWTTLSSSYGECEYVIKTRWPYHQKYLLHEIRGKATTLQFSNSSVAISQLPFSRWIHGSNAALTTWTFISNKCKIAQKLEG